MSDMKQVVNLPQANTEINKKSASWIIWLLPIVALSVGAWLVYKSIVEADVEFVLYFEKGANIIPHETAIVYEGVKLGTVKKLSLTQDLKGIEATVELKKNAASMLQEDTLFWIVEPEVTITRVTGLETLLSGKYIAIDLGKKTSKLTRDELVKLKPAKWKYTALEEPPLQRGGLHLKLTAHDAGSVAEGAPVLFNNIKVGMVEKVRLINDRAVEFDLFIEDDYKKLVKKDARFWDVSGFKFQGNLSKIEIQIGSLSTLFVGGVAFSSPRGSKVDTLAKDGSSFELFKEKTEAFAASYKINIAFKNGEGLNVGTLLKYNGIIIGEVTNVSIAKDFQTVKVTASLIESAIGAARKGTKYWVVKPELGLAGTKNIETLVTGRYITIKPVAKGKRVHKFVGLEEPPVIEDLLVVDDGLRVTLQAPSLGSVKHGVDIYYRKVPVGKVIGTALAGNARHVLIYVLIEPEFAPLVRQNTRFWNAGGVEVDLGLLSGAKIRTESLESLLEGGIAFATPNNEEMGGEVKGGETFTLHKKVKEKWLEWSPELKLKK